MGCGDDRQKYTIGKALISTIHHQPSSSDSVLLQSSPLLPRHELHLQLRSSNFFLISSCHQSVLLKFLASSSDLLHQFLSFFLFSLQIHARISDWKIKFHRRLMVGPADSLNDFQVRPRFKWFSHIFYIPNFHV